jgi:hypothetical protein
LITSYEVGAVLKVFDEVSPVLAKMAVAAREFDAIIIRIKESLGGLSSQRFTGLIGRIGEINKQLDGTAVSADISAKAISGVFGAVDASAASSLATVKALKAEMASMGRLPGGMGGGGAPPGIRGRGTHGGGGAHFGRMGVGPHGLSAPHYSMAATPIMAAGAALGYGAYLDAEMEDAIFQIEYHTGQKDTPENNAKFRKIIQDAMSQTGSSLSSVTEATKQEVRMFKGTPGGGVDVLPEMLRAAATEAKLKGTSLEESMTALIGLAHMTKEYSPEQIKKLAPAFAFLSASNPSSLGGMERAASYAVPIPLDKRAGYEKQLFGTQGFGGFALLADPAVRQQVASLGSEMNSPAFKNRYGSFMQDYSAASPLQLGRQTWADAQVALMDLGKTVLPSVTQALKDIDKEIIYSEAQVKAFAAAISPAVDALHRLGGAIGGAISGVVGAFKSFGTGAPSGPSIHPGRDVHSPAAGPYRYEHQAQAEQQPIHIKTALYLDGSVIAEHMSTAMARLTTFPRQSANADPYASWMAPDYNTQTG